MTSESSPGRVHDPLTVPLEVLRHRTSEKWRHYPPDVLPLWVAEMDVDLAPSVVSALQRTVRSSDTGYQCGTDYQQAFASFAQQSWGWEPDTARMETVPDVMQGVMALLAMVMPAGGPVVVSTPAYPPLLEFPRAAGFEVITTGLTAQGRLDLEAIADTFRAVGRTQPPSTRNTTRVRGVYLLCNPHNPTGTVHTREELSSLAALADDHGIVLVSDEIHAPLTTVAFTPLLTVTQRGYSLTSASKAWNLAGLKSALVVAGREAPQPVIALPPHVRGMGSHVAAIAHTAALTGSRDWLADLNAALAVRRNLVAALLAHRIPTVRFQPPQGTYLAWLDFRDCRTLRGDPLGEDPARYLLREAKVALTPGAAFNGPGFARLNFAASQELLVQAVDQMAEVLA